MSTGMRLLKHNYTDPGFAQTHFVFKNNNNQEVYYCLMDDDGSDVNLYRTSPDGEADYQLSLKQGASITFEKPEDEFGMNLLYSYVKKANQVSLSILVVKKH